MGLISSMGLIENIKALMHDDAVSIIRELSKYQQNMENIPQPVKGYSESWK